MGECRTLGNVGQKRAWSFPRLCTQYTYSSIGILQYINLSRMFHIFTYQMLILYANKRTLQNRTHLKTRKPHKCCWGKVGQLWGNVGHRPVRDILVKYWLYEIRFLWKKNPKNTVETLYNMVNFCWSTHKRHSIARPKGRGMGCLLWVQRATYSVDLSKLSSIKYLL